MAGYHTFPRYGQMGVDFASRTLANLYNLHAVRGPLFPHVEVAEEGKENEEEEERKKEEERRRKRRSNDISSSQALSIEMSMSGPHAFYGVLSPFDAHTVHFEESGHPVFYRYPCDSALSHQVIDSLIVSMKRGRERDFS